MKPGDVIERCNLMPGIVQEVTENDIKSYDLSYVSDTYTGGSCCNHIHCGVRIISYEFALMLLALGKDRLVSIYKELEETTPKGIDIGELYDLKVKETYNKLIYETNLG